MDETTDKQVRRRPGGRVPLDLAKLQAAVTAWQEQDPAHSVRELARRAGLTAAHLDGVLLGKWGISPAKLRQVTAELQVPFASVLSDAA
jgi:transcriptional regulator with XRE-family HTH domain